MTITNLAGARVWTGYDGPHGEQIASTTRPNSGSAGVSLGWHGADNRLTDRSLIQMGARPYSPTLGRFLSVDPIEGGCANDYVYVHGDPMNHSDLSGYLDFPSLEEIGGWFGDKLECAIFEFTGVGLGSRWDDRPTMVPGSVASGGNGGGRSQGPAEQGSDAEEIARNLLEEVGEESLKELLEQYGYKNAARRLARFGSYCTVYEALVAINKCF